MEGMVGPKANNDILIPRSILKKNELRAREFAQMQLNHKDGVHNILDTYEEFEELNGHGPDHQLSPREGVVGRHLDADGPILSPKTFNANYLEN